MTKDLFAGNQAAQPTWKVGNLPFVYTIQSTPVNGRFPDLLPFELSIDERFGLFIQSRNEQTISILQQAYENGSVLSGLMEESGNGLEYAMDFQCFIEEFIYLRGIRVLEIGCGSGYFLSRLRAQGATVLGVEPGVHGQSGAGKYGLTIVKGYFPTTAVTGLFDLICCFGVLEHSVDPVSFLNSVQNQLAPGGKLVLAVPDCGGYLAAGDVSIFFHEHWSYFTRTSLRRLISSVFQSEAIIKKAKYGGTIYALVTNETKSDSLTMHSSHITKEQPSLHEFRNHSLDNIERFWSIVDSVWIRDEVIGIFVPWRAMNVLGAKFERVRQEKLRFIDDNPLLHGTFYPGFAPVVESMNDLLLNPPDCLLIMSRTFGDTIAAKLHQKGFVAPVMTWNDLYR